MPTCGSNVGFQGFRVAIAKNIKLRTPSNLAILGKSGKGWLHFRGFKHIRFDVAGLGFEHLEIQ